MIEEDNKEIAEEIKASRIDFSSAATKKNITILILLILAVIALGIFVVKKYKPPVVVEGCHEGDVFSQTTGKPCNGEEPKTCQPGEIFDRNTGAPCLGSVDKNATPSAEYQATLTEYAGKSMLFNDKCVPDVNPLNIKVGTKIVIANNSQTILELVTGGANAILPPYRSAFSTFAKAGKFPVSCNGKDVASVVVK